MNNFDKLERSGDRSFLRLFITVATGVVLTAIFIEIFPGLSAVVKIIGYLIVIVAITFILGLAEGFFVAYDLTVLCKTPTDIELAWDKISNGLLREPFSPPKTTWFPPLWLHRETTKKKISCISTKKENLEYLKRLFPNIFGNSLVKKRSILSAYRIWALRGRRMISYRDVVCEKLVMVCKKEKLKDIAVQLKYSLEKSFKESVKLQSKKSEIWLNIRRHVEPAPILYKVVFQKPAGEEVPSAYLSLNYSGPPLNGDLTGSQDIMGKRYRELMKKVKEAAKKQGVEVERDVFSRALLANSIISRKKENCFVIRSVGSIPKFLF